MSMNNFSMFLIAEPQKIQKDDRAFFVDAIRAYAIILVLLLHTTAPLLTRFSTLDARWWWIANFLFSYAHHSVPLFVMISGMLLLNPDKNETVMLFFRKRMIKVVVPFLFWGVVYIFWEAYLHGKRLTIAGTFYNLIEGPISYHLWFIYMILGIYLATPILRVYVKAASIKQLIYFIALWFFAVSIRPILGLIGVNFGIQIVVVNGFVGYFVLGHLFRYIDLRRKYAVIIFIIAIIFTILTAIGTYILTVRHSGEYRSTFVGMLMPNIVITSVCMFWLLKTFPYDRVFKRLPSGYTVVRVLSSTSFSIYLLHAIVLDILGSGKLGFMLSAMSIHPLIGIPITFFATLVLCILIVTLLRKIPYLRGVVT